ncbi:MAG TPA: NADP-dependent oxidoreductase [Gammaproteobacteria bacterium]|nr:NADP-dependent oxidoreductase [Gammaproteobacteria bacterium]
MATMKAIRIHEYGGPDVLCLEDVPIPVPAAGEVLIRVHAAGINPVDWKIREGRLQGRVEHRLPLILGWDVAGVIEALGPGVTQFKTGDAVYARPDIARDGGYAEYIAVRASEVALKPKSLDFIHAAAVPLAALTAWQALFDAAKLVAGQKILVHAGAGGVGSYAVQFAHWKGARVIATASARNADLVRSLGADQVIDYTQTRFEDEVRDLDAVFDTVGEEVQQRSWQVLKKGGILVSILALTVPDDAAARGLRSAYVFVQPNAAQLGQIAELIDGGHVKPVVETVLPLSEVRRTHELSQSRHARGKIVLRIVD